MSDVRVESPRSSAAAAKSHNRPAATHHHFQSSDPHHHCSKGAVHRNGTLPDDSHPNDFTQQVDFDGGHRAAQHGHADMTGDNLKLALHFYGSLDRAFLRNVLIRHFEDRELENLFSDMQDMEDEKKDMASALVTHGQLNFDQYNQRFIGVPVACKKEFPQETFKTDRYPYKLNKLAPPDAAATEPSSSTPSQILVVRRTEGLLIPPQQETSTEAFSDTGDRPEPSTSPSITTAAAVLVNVQPEQPSPKKKTYIRIGDINQCPVHLQESLPHESPLHHVPVTLTAAHVDPPSALESTASFAPPGQGNAMKKSFHTTSSLLSYPGIKSRFNETTVGDDQTPEREIDQVVQAGTFPDHSDMEAIYHYVQQYGELIWADETSLYTPDHGRDTLRKMGSPGPFSAVTSQVLHVAATQHPAFAAYRTGQAIRHNWIEHDLRHAMTTGFDGDVNVLHLMAIPLRSLDGPVRGVVVFSRVWRFTAPFPDELFSTAIEDVTGFARMVWRGADCRRELNTYRVLGHHFQELFIQPTNWDNVLYKFMLLIKSQLNPDRIHLFRLNHGDNRAVASIFDTGRLSPQCGYHFDYSGEVILPVQETFLRNLNKIGDLINAKSPADAWLSDSGLNDLIPGPKIRNFLAMAFTEDWEGKVCEVVVLVNAVGAEGFLRSEERILQTLLSFWYAAMGMHYFRFRLNTTAQPFRLESELFYRLSNESRDDVAELEQLCDRTGLEPPADFFSFDFYCVSLMDDDFTLPRLMVLMMDVLFGADGFHRNKLMSLVIAIREGYRNIRYHSWQHGFHVAHCLFCILHLNPELLSTIERKALMIGAVCHDLDHLGYTNVFIKKFSSPFEHLYPASQMENHHIRETFRLMANPENDIIADWPAADKSDFCLLVKEAIIATDLVQYFAGRTRLDAGIETGLNMANAADRRRLMDLIMSCSDLCIAAKPWPTQIDSTTDLYDEFHSQGDVEKMYGGQPIPMMDGGNAANMEREQTGFIQVVCLPMYSMLARALPNTAGLRDGCVRNIASWQEEAVRADEHRAEAARHHRHHHHHHHHDEPDPSDETDPTAQGGSADGRKSPNVDEHHHHGHGHCHHHGHCHGGHHDGGESSGGQQQPLHSSVMGEHDHAYGRHSMQMGAAAAAHHHHAHHNAHGHSS